MSSLSSKKHDVFISFRGEDTREGIISHLRTALEHKFITFTDSKLKKGYDVWSGLDRAIKDSHISIVVFSQNYATSKWCLNELIEIMKCKKDEGQVVMPVFYRIDPSRVRKQTGSYKDAFVKLEQDLRKDGSFKDDEVAINRQLSEWKMALKGAANINGWDSLSRNFSDDSELVQEIVTAVEQDLYKRYPIELGKGILQNNEVYEEIESKLEKNVAVGIWGMGGIGKTTTAKILFNKHSRQYDCACFLENVREEHEKHNSLKYLLAKLLSGLLNQQIDQSNAESSYYKEKIRKSKLFIVLDDVSSFEQLEYLRGELGELSQDSRLIVTTRNTDSLRDGFEVYELKEWEPERSRELFCLRAFKKEQPEEGYKDLVARAVGYAGGVPLALSVLGSHLYKRYHDFWEDALNKIEEYPLDKIQRVLRVSYDGLDPQGKATFLDIAFFHKGEDEVRAKSILRASGFNAGYEITILQDRALITISHNHKIQVHELLQQMSWDIVRGELKQDSRVRHSRLRKIEEFKMVLNNEKDTCRVQGITLDLSETDALYLSSNAFKMMNRLRFLRIRSSWGTRSNNVSISDEFSNELRYFEWHGYPFQSLPQNFCAKLLVEIHMPCSDVKELWQGKQDLVNLEGIYLSGCKKLTKLPDLSPAKKLKWVNLSGCERLGVVNPSDLSQDTLVTLILDRCKNLQSLESEKLFPNLEIISVDGCSSLKKFSMSSGSIKRLDLRNTGIEKIHQLIMHKLVWLNLEGLRLKNLPDDLSQLKELEELRISNCNEVINKQKLHVLLCTGLRSLKILHLKDCDHLSKVPNNIKVLSQLNELRLDGSTVKKLPSSIKHLQELEILSLENCRELQSLPKLPPFIREFCADNCTSLVSVSTLMSFTEKMKGNQKQKSISFKNCTKLSEESIQCLVEGTQLTMMSEAFRSGLLNIQDEYCYNIVQVRFPGSRVPSGFKYQTAESSSITIKFPARCIIGFIYCVVLSSSGGMENTESSDAKIQCECYRKQDGKEVTCASTWPGNVIRDLNSDHVYAWFDALHTGRILRSHENHLCFRFRADNGGDKHDGMISIKECGVRVICVSDLDNCLLKKELKKEKLELGLKQKLEVVSDIVQRYVKIESKCLVALKNSLDMHEAFVLDYRALHRAILTLLRGEGTPEIERLRKRKRRGEDIKI